MAALPRIQAEVHPRPRIKTKYIRFMIQFNKETCGNLDATLRREWLETNGLGGFASSSTIGLSPVAVKDCWWPLPSRPSAATSRSPSLFIDSQPFDLSANRYPGTQAGIRRIFEVLFNPAVPSRAVD
jgi:hypothetical protein